MQISLLGMELDLKIMHVYVQSLIQADSPTTSTFFGIKPVPT